jgi:hypothetical protein
MCLDSTYKVEEVCTVGDLKSGQRYRTPDREEFLKTDSLPNMVVNVRTGEVIRPDLSTKLGYDQAGRLYAARRLNKPTAPDASISVSVSP